MANKRSPREVPKNRYNKLISGPACIDSKDPGWAQTQTVPPTNLQAAPQSGSSVQLTWTPILYTGDGGFYEVWYATSAGGSYVLHGTTGDKSATGYLTGNLTPGITYYFRVRTYTPAHGTQQNALWSDYTQEVSAAPWTPTPTPTRTPTPTPTRTPTPTPTATPSGPWLNWREPDRPLLLPPRGTTLDVLYGNIAAPAVLTATLTGPATFADSSQALTATVIGADGSYTFDLRPAADAPRGATFTLEVTLAGLRLERVGTIVQELYLPLMLKR